VHQKKRRRCSYEFTVLIVEARTYAMRWWGSQRLFGVQSIGTVYRNPTTIWQCMHNVVAVLRFIEGAMFERLEGCGAHDIVLGNVPALVTLLRTLRDKYDNNYAYERLLRDLAAEEEAAEEEEEEETRSQPPSAVAAPILAPAPTTRIPSEPKLAPAPKETKAAAPLASPKPVEEPRPKSVEEPKRSPKPVEESKLSPKPAEVPKPSPKPVEEPKAVEEPKPSPKPKEEPKPSPKPKDEPKPSPTPKDKPKPSPKPAEPAPAEAAAPEAPTTKPKAEVGLPAEPHRHSVAGTDARSHLIL